jgi:hypothetical protein
MPQVSPSRSNWHVPVASIAVALVLVVLLVMFFGGGSGGS